MESLPYDEVYSNIWRERPVLPSEGFKTWVAYGMVGVVVGFTAFVLEILEENLTHLASGTIQ